ncbi:MAG: hypothetical protein NT138_01820 [Planctomycetales bacterium]|nr:hypothetical protein [Planctomycetales bacterium]
MAVPRVEAIPHKIGSLLQLDDGCSLFVPGSMNDTDNAFGLRMAWNQEGLGIELDMPGKKLPPAGRHKDLKNSDYISLFVDTRHTANVHRATEYCLSLVVLPCDEDADEKPSAAFVEIAQQRASRRDRDGRKCPVQVHVRPDGYRLEIWIPTSQMFGFDEAPEIGRIGFSCLIHDTELGEIPLNVGGDFPVAFDPSTWLQLELKS